MKKIFLLIILTLCAKPAPANIALYPHSLEFDVSSKKRVQNVRVINNSDGQKTYRVSFVNLAQTNTGAYRELTPEDSVNTAEQYLFFSPRQFTLKPGQVQTLNIMRRPAADMADGEYVSHLKIAEVHIPNPREKAASEEGGGDKTLTIKLKALYAVTIPVIIHKGALESKVEISEIFLRQQDGRPALEAVLRSEGTQSARGDIIVLDSKKKVIGRSNNVRIFPYIKERRILIYLSKTEQELKGKTISVTFKDKEPGKNVPEKKISF